MPTEQRLSEIDWSALLTGRAFYPSPAAWEDETLYFLFVDRFSDGKEFGGFADNSGNPVSGPTNQRTTPLFTLSDAWTADRESWFASGRTWRGGTLSGLSEKLGYLKRMGITAIWLSPIFKQVTGSDDYHGYGIQNFLDVDPHYGTREDVKSLVTEAHQLGIRVILDIILNHAGDVFAYQGGHPYYYHQGNIWPIEGFRIDKSDMGSLPFGPVDLNQNPNAWSNAAIWPAEFQNPSHWTRKGEIRGWDAYPEYLEADFLSLKDLDHGTETGDPPIPEWDVLKRIREFRPSSSLFDLINVYKFWIAHSDLDGFRLDTVKHMKPGSVRIFCNAIREFCESIGKENFYIIGEVTGGRSRAVNLVNTTGLSAALGINDIPDKLEYLVKGYRTPGNPETEEQEGYFDLFRNSVLDNKETHQWFGSHVVTMFDDHDQVGTKHKYRFCGDSPGSYRFLKAAIGLNLTTLGIPCLYYGTEQGFNGADYRTADDSYSDAFLRECMFGGDFGSLQSSGKHFFNENHEIYAFVSELNKLRKNEFTLRRGRQYLRQISNSGSEGDFHYPQMIENELRWVVAWSRIFSGRELICAMNTDPAQELTVWITIDSAIHEAGTSLKCLLSTNTNQIGYTTTIESRNGLAIQISLPPTGFSIWG